MQSIRDLAYAEKHVIESLLKIFPSPNFYDQPQTVEEILAKQALGPPVDICRLKKKAESVLLNCEVQEEKLNESHLSHFFFFN